MNTVEPLREYQHGVGLVEVMISIIIGMLMVLVIYQVYEVSERQKRTITAGSDAQQNASYGLYALGRELSMAGNGIASSATALDQCPILRPIPVLIQDSGSDNLPDSMTVLYGGSSSLSTPVRFIQTAAPGSNYVVPGPVGFSQNDVIAAVQGPQCTVSRINAAPGSVTVNPANGFANIAHTRIAGASGVTYTAVISSLVNLGQWNSPNSMRSVVYDVDYDPQITTPQTATLRARRLLPTPDPNPMPLISEVVNLKVQYGVDANCGGALTWTKATGPWSAANVATLPLPQTPPGCLAGVPSLQQIRAVRLAIVTRSAQFEKDPVTPGPLTMFDGAGTVTMTLRTGCPPCDQHYRYKVLETIVPMRNALWNGP